MVILIGGASHTGKTLLARKLLAQYHYPCLSMDHLKMGLIRSSQTELTPMDDDKLTDYLWPILREMIKTAIENRQDLILEGCYIPEDWHKDFPPEYLKHIRCIFLVMTEGYIRSHWADIVGHACVAEQRLCDAPDMEELIRDNLQILESCRKYGHRYLLIDTDYAVDPVFADT